MLDFTIFLLYRRVLLALHIPLICSITLSFGQVHVKRQQPHVFSPEPHVTIGMIQGALPTELLHCSSHAV